MSSQENRYAIDLDQVEFGWPGGRFFLGVDVFRIPEGEAWLLLGESGSGKSTLLNLICGTVPPSSGSVRLAGTDLTGLSSARRDRFRANNIGIIFQMFNLLPYASALDNVLLALQFAPERRARCKDPQAEAMALLRGLGLPDGLLTMAAAATLSVGQQQRVAMARAMIGSPKIVIADEPTSALDAGAQTDFLDLAFAQIRAIGATLLMVSHDPRLGERFDKVVTITDIARVTRDRAA